MVIGTIALAVTGVVLAVLVSLCAAGVIGPNPLVGIRLPALFASRDSWQEGHRAAALPVWLGAVAASVLGASAVLLPALVDWGIPLTGVPVLAGLVWGTVRASSAANAALTTRRVE
jgi:hypothetical protein